MSKRNNLSIDKPFLIAVLVLTLGGFLMFLSAALGLVVNNGAPFAAVVTNQFIALTLGLILMFSLSFFHYPVWRRLSLAIFLLAVLFTLLLFVPGLSLEHGGGARWLAIGSFSFQPAEMLKFAFVIYCAAWLSGVQKRINKWAYGLVPLIILFIISGILLLLQPDTNSFILIVSTGVAMFFVGGARIRDVGILLSFGSISFLGLLYSRPYLYQRITTLFNPDLDSLGSNYHINQALIAVGSGQWWGRGYGQSIQKFLFLPESIGDSIFAVIGEEFGFLGVVLLISMFMFLLYRGLKMATRIPDIFGRLLIVGFLIMIITQFFTNTAGMIKIFPLSGTPLPFISHGGSALLFVLMAMGIILNISRYQKTPKKLSKIKHKTICE